MFAVGLFVFLIYGALALVCACALVAVAVRVGIWGLAAPDGTGARSAVRISLGLGAAILLVSPFGFPFVRDLYLNHLCDTESRMRILVRPSSWSPSVMSPNAVGYQYRVGAIYRNLIAPGLVLDYIETDEGLGVYRSTEVFRDFGTQAELAKVVTFTTKMPLVPSSIDTSMACAVPGAFGLRMQYEARSKTSM